MKEKLKIAVLGYIVRGPLGGLVWHHFQYVYGLVQMGHEVLFIEDSEKYASCYNPETFELTKDPSYGLAFIKNIFSKYGLKANWTYYDFHTNKWFGKTKNEVDRFLKETDVLLNISGVNPLRERMRKIPKKVFIDTDPVFTQIRHLTEPDALNLAQQHNVFFTFGENFGKSNCSIPDDGMEWKHTRQPVVLDFWENENIKNNGIWTTVMQWDSYKVREWENQQYGMKSKSFNLFADLPKLVPEKFELAIGSESAPKEKLKELGWGIANPLEVTKTPESYQNYIWRSKGECGIAKHGYVVTNSGWFSERSAAYLACSKPVIVQETGFSDCIETGAGLFSFKNISELKEIFQMVHRDYDFHSKKAWEICSSYFNQTIHK
ncbi:MAG: hypothetical protein HOG79_10395 [Prolixibacteraceae bacterium]|nr:hypothetical protein [Prolixibacteraceae bacterium]